MLKAPVLTPAAKVKGSVPQGNRPPTPGSRRSKAGRTNNVASVHGHPILARERADAEVRVRAMITENGRPVNFYDVGGQCGGFMRFFHAAPVPKCRYHGINPVISPADVVRSGRLRAFNAGNSVAIRAKSMRYCQHTLETCTCLVAPQRNRVFLFCHSFYYMTLRDLDRLDLDDEVFIVAHEFKGEYGGFPSKDPEFTWQRGADGIGIRMVPTRPGGTTYEHRDVGSWLVMAVEDGFRISNPKRPELLLCLTVDRVFGSSVLYHGFVGPALRPAKIGFIPYDPKILEPVATKEEADPFDWEKIDVAAAALCSKVNESYSPMDYCDHVRRTAASLMQRFSLPPAAARQVALDSTETAMLYSRGLTDQYFDNEILNQWTDFKAKLDWSEPQPIYGPWQTQQYPPRPKPWYIRWPMAVIYFFYMVLLGPYLEELIKTRVTEVVVRRTPHYGAGHVGMVFGIVEFLVWLRHNWKQRYSTDVLWRLAWYVCGHAILALCGDMALPMHIIVNLSTYVFDEVVPLMVLVDLYFDSDFVQRKLTLANELYLALMSGFAAVAYECVSGGMSDQVLLDYMQRPIPMWYTEWKRLVDLFIEGVDGMDDVCRCLSKPVDTLTYHHCQACRVDVCGEFNWTQHLNGIKHLRRTGAVALDRVAYCGLCNVHVSGAENMRKHQMGERHKRMAGAPVLALLPQIDASIVGSLMPSSGLLDPGSIDFESLLQGYYKLVSNVTGVVCLGYAPSTTLDPKHKVVIEQGPCSKETQKGAYLMGWSTRTSYVMASCRCNFQNALVKRHGVLQPPVNWEFCYARNLLSSILGELNNSYTVHLYDQRYAEAWLKKWSQAKRDGILKSEADDPVDPRRVSSFIKRENNHDLPSKARLIQAYANLATQARWGPEFCAIQKALCGVFDGSRYFDGITICIASGMTMARVALWAEQALESFPHGVWYERDGKNWDATMQRAHLELKRLAFSPCGPDFDNFIVDSFEVEGSAKSDKSGLKPVKYHLKGTVKSGHNDTSSGNSVVNAMIAAEALNARGVKGAIIVQGDDLLVRTDRYVDAESLIQVESACGIIPEARCFNTLFSCSFLSAIWAPTGDPLHPLAFIPKPGRIIARSFWTVQQLSNKLKQSWANEVADCLMIPLNNVPVVRVWLQRHCGDGAPDDLRVGDRDYSAFAGVVQIVDCTEWFCQRYGLSRGDIQEAEEFLSGLPLGALIIKHRVLSRLMEVDLADIFDREDYLYE